jgi:hypothetical protein
LTDWLTNLAFLVKSLQDPISQTSQQKSTPLEHIIFKLNLIHILKTYHMKVSFTIIKSTDLCPKWYVSTTLTAKIVYSCLPPHTSIHMCEHTHMAHLSIQGEEIWVHTNLWLFVPKREGVTRDWAKLNYEVHNEEFIICAFHKIALVWWSNQRGWDGQGIWHA